MATKATDDAAAAWEYAKSYSLAFASSSTAIVAATVAVLELNPSLS